MRLFKGFEQAHGCCLHLPSPVPQPSLPRDRCQPLPNFRTARHMLILATLLCTPLFFSQGGLTLSGCCDLTLVLHVAREPWVACNVYLVWAIRLTWL
jgi:hypothetical protein